MIIGWEGTERMCSSHANVLAMELPSVCNQHVLKEVPMPISNGPETRICEAKGLFRENP